MNFRGRANTGDLSGFLEVGCQLEGELRFEQSFRVDGKVKGNVRSDGDLVVGERGEVEGDIRVGRLYVSGLVRGEVHVTKRLSIHARGRVLGEVHAAALVIDEGGVLEGRCAMAEEGNAQAGESAPRETVEERQPAAKVVGRIKAS
ncbi:MAG: polymer-forming cytoskeletal protein [Thermoanaerobaculia bacterium]